VASGKSLVAQQLRELGAAVLDGDQQGHEVLRETDVIEQLRHRFGDTVLKSDGSINRRAVAQQVFAQSAEGRRDLEFLEKLTHPRIGTRLSRRLEELRQQGQQVVVLDAALMFKAGWNRHCDRILYVDAPREVRLARALRRGWSEQNFNDREASQTPLEVKKLRSTDTIDNSGSPEQTRGQVEQFWDSLKLG
jgi:dephospho-CoA kinase